jgi:hypothetical protein
MKKPRRTASAHTAARRAGSSRDENVRLKVIQGAGVAFKGRALETRFPHALVTALAGEDVDLADQSFLGGPLLGRSLAENRRHRARSRDLLLLSLAVAAGQGRAVVADLAHGLGGCAGRRLKSIR